MRLQDGGLEPRAQVRVDAGVDTNLGPWFQAAVLQAHEPGAVGTTSPFPFWVTSQRFALVIVTPDIAADQNAIRRIHLVMQRLARGVSTWAIASTTGPGTAGPFKVNVSPLGTTTIGTVTYP